MKKRAAGIISTAVILLIVAYTIFFVGKVTATLNDDSIRLKCTLVGSTSVPYDEINSIEYVENFNIGSRSIGMGSFKINAGTYKNSEFGTYKLYSYNNVNAFVKVLHDDGVLVFNQSDEESTKALFDRLVNKLSETST